MYQKHASYQLADFVTDEEFIEWVRRPTPHADAYWKEFLEIFPHQSSTIYKARLAVKMLIQESGETQGAEQDARQIWDTIEQSLDSPKSVSFSLFLKPYVRWAAVLALICLAGAGWWAVQSLDKTSESNYQTMIQDAKILAAMEEVTNLTDQPRRVTLPDGSLVVLEKDSRLSYAKSFMGSNLREVYLTGEAYFDVAKDPQKPFLVFSNELVTKVIGTSFRIKAFDSEKNIVVSVRSGRVSVYAHKSGMNADPETTGLLLTPNQEVQFDRAGQRFSRTLIEKPMALLNKEELQQFSFEDAPVSRIFDALEKVYGVEIVFDEEVLSNCRLTTSLSAETLFEKLEVICEGIGATYKLVDAHVVISGKGCN
ncbi:FecR family protein [Arundinibacter roseus]|uniref:FecR family protein n=1 Tax=Arundinibacter roseus TaxID=2070510 RepID=A0A4R4K5Z6_9BACT|nr:FecR family protein [Arundinibacter roseus]TDB62743.1 FecR family protein [Arundinibacter roseus]